METMHGTSQMDVDDNKENRASVLCPGCPAAFSRNIQLSWHCQKIHSSEGGDFAIVRENFDNVDVFETWKRQMELKTITHLAIMTTWTTSKGTTTAYTCQHARGKTLIVDRKEEKKRYKEGRRVHTHCPCFLKVRICR